MDQSKFLQQALPTLTECSRLLTEAARLLESKNAIVLIESEGLYSELLYAFNKVVRKLPAGNGIDVVFHSHGGTTDVASAITSLCKERFGSFRVIVPFMAKSAASIFVLAADERLLTCSAQLGPVDPQIRHPEKRDLWFPAHSIREALDLVQATKDPIVRASLADKLDPFLIGAYQDTISATKQYVEEIVQGWNNVKDKDAVVSAFTDRYKSHGHPIGRSVLKALNVPYKPIEGEAERVICDIHEKCLDVLETEDEGCIILTKDEYLFRAGDFKEYGKFSVVTAISGQTPQVASART